MKKIDVYICRKFLLFYCAALAGFIIMLIIVDISGKIDNISEMEGAFLLNCIIYYARELPFMLNLLLPLVSVLAVLFTLISLKKNNEIVSILSSGISIHRVIGVQCIMLALTIPIYFANSEIVVPYLSKLKQENDDRTLRTSIITDEHASMISANSISLEDHTAEYVSITLTDSATGQLQLFLFTPLLEWDPDKKIWDFEKAQTILKTKKSTMVNPRGIKDIVQSYDPVLFGSPGRLRISARLPSNLSIKELMALSPSRQASVEFCHRISFPFVMYMIILITAPFSVHHSRNASALPAVGIGLGSLILVYGVMFLGIFMGGKGILAAPAAGFFPFIVFSIPAFLIYSDIDT